MPRSAVTRVSVNPTITSRGSKLFNLHYRRRKGSGTPTEGIAKVPCIIDDKAQGGILDPTLSRRKTASP